MNVALHRGPLLASHDTLDLLFAELVEAARERAWDRCDRVAETFAIALDVHFRHEETLHFPRYAAVSRHAADEVEDFLAEHRMVRCAVGNLLADLRARTLREAAIDRVEFLLRDHDEHEASRFSPWQRSLLELSPAHAP
jgi:hypothetical protein